MTDSADSEEREIWRFQNGTAGGREFAYAGAASLDGGFVLVGSTEGDWGATSAGGLDFAVAKIDSDGNFVWVWQEGTAGNDELHGVVALEDGSVVVAGYVNGTWNGEPSIGADDFAAVKLDSDGTVVWRWRNGTVEDDHIRALVMTADGTIVLSGHTYGDFGGTSPGVFDAVAIKLDTDGQELWRYQAGTTLGYAYMRASAARPDGSVVLAGGAFGSWRGDMSGIDADMDFAAVALDGDGEELWRWQDGTGDGESRIYGAMALVNGSVVLAGVTNGDWNGTNVGSNDFAAVKLDMDGVEEWRYQNGTMFDDKWESAVADTDGSIILAGFTQGSWLTTIKGVRNFAAVSLDAAGATLWSYQAGTGSYDEVDAAVVGADGTVLLAGWSDGSWVESDSAGDADMAAVLLNTRLSTTPAPATVIQPSPFPLTPAPTATIHPSPVSGTAAPTGDVPAEPSPSSTSSAAVGSIIGGVVGGAVLLVIVAVVLRRRQVATRKDKSLDNAPSPGSHTDGVSCTAPAGGAPSQRFPVSLTEAELAPSTAPAGRAPSQHFPFAVNEVELVPTAAPAGRAPSQYFPVALTDAVLAPVPPAGDALRAPPNLLGSEPPTCDDAVRS